MYLLKFLGCLICANKHREFRRPMYFMVPGPLLSRTGQQALAVCPEKIPYPSILAPTMLLVVLLPPGI